MSPLLDVAQMSEVRLRAITYHHECVIARMTAYDELSRRGVVLP